MDITSIDMRHESREKSSRARIEFFADEARARGLGKRCVERALEAIHGPQDSGVHDTKHAGWTTQFSLLFRRSLVNQRRDAVGVGVQVTIELVYALIVSALFRGVGTDQKGVQDRIGCLFFVVLNVAYTAALPAINLFASERDPLHFQFLRLVNRLVTQLITRSSATAPKRTGGTHSLPNPQPAAAAVPRARPYFPIQSMVSAPPINSAPMQMGRNPPRVPPTARPRSPFRTPAGGFRPPPAEGPGSTSAAASCTMRRSTPSCSARRPLASRRT